MKFCSLVYEFKERPAATFRRGGEPQYNRTVAMLRMMIPALMAGMACAAGPVYELEGNFAPAGVASVSLFGVSGPYQSSTLSDSSGRFSFKKLEAGTYTLAVFLPTDGEVRQTIEIGPSAADNHGHIRLSFAFQPSDFARAPALARHTVTAKQLTIPDKAVRLFEEASRFMARRDSAAASARLQQAVALAPQFSAAWNELGTIHYMRQEYPQAADCFRQALDADPGSYEPLVNLGGVLINLHKLEEAWDYNVHAVLLRPTDALANSQLGMTYFEMGHPEMAEKYFSEAVKLDPAHFSHPQLFLAEIHLRRGDRKAAATDLDNFLQHHPDWPQAAKMRQAIEQLRQ